MARKAKKRKVRKPKGTNWQAGGGWILPDGWNRDVNLGEGRQGYGKLRPY